ncbi:MAG: CehA/McbA family metallohydrolase [Deltaproteobacteria bacterium]|nr:CehA/McbA family metallohydrolase [Deltaproteobacteria bacterium]
MLRLPTTTAALAGLAAACVLSLGAGCASDGGGGPDPTPDATLDAATGDVPGDDVTADVQVPPPVDPALVLRKVGWLSGDLHLHSNLDDGEDPIGTIVALAEYLATPEFLAFHPEYAGNPIGFIALTDHRMVDGNSDPAFVSDEVVLIPGEEFGGPGHAGIWGLSTVVEHDPGGDGADLADYRAGVDAAHAQGALFSMNHPGLPKNPFPWDVRTHDAMEVWNTRWGLQGAGYTADSLAEWEAANGPASPFFRRAVQVQDEGGSGQWLRFYEAQLSLGIHVALVGGSDRHILFPVGFPSTWVRAATRDQAGVLDGIRKRHTFVTRSPASATVEMTIELPDGTVRGIGDRVPVPAGGVEAKVTLRVGRADEGRVRLVRGTRAAGDVALASHPLGQVAFEAAVDAVDFTATTTQTLRPGDWLYPVVHDRLIPDGLDPALAARIPDKVATLSKYSEDNYAPIMEALIEFIDPDVVLAPELCDPAKWVATDAQCMLADANGMATFFFPDWIDRLLNILTEGGRPSDWAMGAVGSAALCVPAT